jgi:predicted lipoprotein with Yx(FWY)xxD motif
MQQRTQLTRLRKLAVLVAATAVGALAFTPTVASAATAPASRGIVISSAVGPFGPQLVVGSGPDKGFSVYMITSDNAPKSYGCTAVHLVIQGHKINCTGKGPNTEWPAVTTTGRPVAGRGVSQKLLGTVRRARVGTQVTYAGHPLYLFDNGPNQVTGEGFNEPGLPPWHGVWSLISPGGYPQWWAGTLTTTTIKGKTVLAAQYETLFGWVNFPLYSFSRDGQGHAACSASRRCARAWPPMLTGGNVGSLGLPTSHIGGLGISGNLTQVTYNGHPLYLFGFEQIGPAGPAGNGNGIKAFGGTFSLVTP